MVPCFATSNALGQVGRLTGFVVVQCLDLAHKGCKV